MGYRVRWWKWNRKDRMRYLQSEVCEDYEEALLLKDRLEADGCADVTIEEEKEETNG